VTEWEAIEERFTRLRDFVLTDLEGFASNETGGNFGLLALVVAACDALGTLRYGSRAAGDKIFERCLPSDWKAVADILFDAIRNGLIHGYDAKLRRSDRGHTGRIRHRMEGFFEAHAVC